MQCPKCKTEMRIGGARYVIDNGHLYYEQDFYCRNKNCANNNQIVSTNRSELPVTTSEKAADTTETVTSSEE